MDDLEKTAPELSGIKRDTPFAVPDGYFENFSSRLGEITHSGSKAVVKDRLVIILKPYLVAAAIIVIALLTGRNFLISHQSARLSRNMHAEISQAVEQELYSINEETILEVMQPDDQEISADPRINPQEAIDYLMNETVNEVDLLNAQ